MGIDCWIKELYKACKFLPYYRYQKLVLKEMLVNIAPSYNSTRNYQCYLAKNQQIGKQCDNQCVEPCNKVQYKFEENSLGNVFDKFGQPLLTHIESMYSDLIETTLNP